MQILKGIIKYFNIIFTLLNKFIEKIKKYIYEVYSYWDFLFFSKAHAHSRTLNGER